MEIPLCPPDDPDFRLIETCLWTPQGGVQHRALHVSRLACSAARLGISPRDVDQTLDGVTGTHAQRLRLTLDVHGRANVAIHPFAPLSNDTIWNLAVSNTRLRAGDPWLGVKTTQRHLYDRARASLPAKADELIFLNEQENLCEGTITNIFADFGDGLITPPASCGLLPGVLRQSLLNSGAAQEGILTIERLKQAKMIYVGNSLRGLIRAKLLND